MFKGEGFRYSDEAEQQKLEEAISQANSFEELATAILRVRRRIHSSSFGLEYGNPHWIEMIKKVRAGELDSSYITRTGGLREKVEKLVFLENEAKRLAEGKKEKELESKIQVAQRILANSSVIKELWPKGLGAKTRQGRAGDCYFLAALHAIERNPLSAVVLTRILEKNRNKKWFQDNGWKVRFNDEGQIREYVITKSDLKEMKLSGKGASSSPGNILLERAYARFIHQKKENKFQEDRSGHTVDRGKMTFEGGQSYRAMKHLIGPQNLEVLIADRPDSMLKSISQVNKKQILCAYSLFYGPEKYSALTVKKDKFQIHSQHAYSIGNVNAKEKWLEVVNPHDTENHVYRISFTEFVNKFSELVGAELNDKFMDTI